eukprot:1994027-Ditylum_brightwellii.AAC.1
MLPSMRAIDAMCFNTSSTASLAFVPRKIAFIPAKTRCAQIVHPKEKHPTPQPAIIPCQPKYFKSTTTTSPPCCHDPQPHPSTH